MNLVYIVYGAAFLALGLAVVLQFRENSRIDLASFLWLLAAFAFTHCILEWTILWHRIHDLNDSGDVLVNLFIAATTLVSFLFLFEFGRRLWLHALPSRGGYTSFRFILHYVAYPLLLTGLTASSVFARDPMLNFVNCSRYIFGFTGSMLVGMGIVYYGREKIMPVLPKSAHHLVRDACRLTAAAFIAYGFFAGLIVSRADWVPALWLNEESFQETLQLPVQVARAACAILAVVAVHRLLRLFWIESQERLRIAMREAESQRAEIEQLTLRDDLVESLAEGVLGVDVHGRCNFVNTTALSLLQCEREHVIGRDPQFYFEFIDGRNPPDHGDKNIFQLCINGATYAGEVAFRRRNGQMVPGYVLVRPLFKANEIVGAVAAFHDISDRKRIGELLRRSEADLQLALDASDQGVWKWNIETGDMMWSERCKALFGLPPDAEVNYEVFTNAIHPDDRERNERLLKQAVETGAPYEVERRIVWPDGSIHWNVSLGRVIFNSAGRPVLMTGVTMDVTERRTAQAVLASFKTTLDHTLDCVFMFDPDTLQFFYVNEGAVRQIGYTREELLKLHPYDIKPEYSEALFRNFIAPMIRGQQQSITFETLHRHRDGHDVPVEIFLQYIKQSGDSPRFVAIVRDVSERKRAEAALRESEARFHTLVEVAPEPILVHVDGRYVYANSAALELLGVQSLEQILGKDVLAIVHPESRDLVRERVSRHQDGDAVPQRVEQRWVRADGAPVDVEVTGVPFLLGGKRAVHVMARDITERKRASMALATSEERLRQAILVSEIGIFDHDQRNDTIYWSPQQRNIHGFAPDDPVSLPVFLALIHPEDAAAVAASVQRAHDPAGDGKWDIEHRIVRRDGTVRWLRSRSQTLFEDEGTGRRPVRTIGAVLDITVQKLAQDQIRELNAGLERRVEQRTRELEKSNAQLRDALTKLERARDDLVRSEKLASLGALVAGIAHELSTPLGNSLTVATTLSDRIAAFEDQLSNSEVASSSFDDMLKQAKHAMRLLTRSLFRASELINNFKKVAVDQTSAKRRTFDLGEVIRETVETLQPQFKGTHHRLTLSAAADLRMDSYPGPLGQVLTNLVMNALVHAFNDSRSGTVSIDATRATDRNVRIVVQDDGCGIAAEHLPFIYDPFFTTRLGRGGSGLGLHIVYTIVTRVLGGRIGVDSRRGQGTVFTVDLPMKAPDSAEAVPIAATLT
jgi:PAS domain S-box-containing protein